jgi:hypothetical protein
MGLTIKEVLDNAEYNMTYNRHIYFAQEIAREQLSNANKLLNNGYDLYDDFDESWEKLKLKEV